MSAAAKTAPAGKTARAKTAAARRETSDAEMHQSFLAYRGFKFLRWATWLTLATIAAYALDRPLTVPNGGTWLGYTLGTIGAAMILWLMWFGMRKRSYMRAGRLQGWLSAHVYLGLALIVVATLHTGFHFGWNIHTLAYALMMTVIASGIFGIVAYARVPDQMTRNRHGQTIGSLQAKVAALDGELRQGALGLDDGQAALVLAAIRQPSIGGSAWRQLSGKRPDCATRRALRVITAADAATEQRAQVQRVLGLLGERLEHLDVIGRDLRYKALMDVWLYAHVPLSFALLAALVAHVIAVFFYF